MCFDKIINNSKGFICTITTCHILYTAAIGLAGYTGYTHLSDRKAAAAVHTTEQRIHAAYKQQMALAQVKAEAALKDTQLREMELQLQQLKDANKPEVTTVKADNTKVVIPFRMAANNVQDSTKNL